MRTSPPEWKSCPTSARMSVGRARSMASALGAASTCSTWALSESLWSWHEAIKRTRVQRRQWPELRTALHSAILVVERAYHSPTPLACKAAEKCTWPPSTRTALRQAQPPAAAHPETSTRTSVCACGFPPRRRRSRKVYGRHSRALTAQRTTRGTPITSSDRKFDLNSRAKWWISMRKETSLIKSGWCDLEQSAGVSSFVDTPGAYLTYFVKPLRQHSNDYPARNFCRIYYILLRRKT